MLYCEYLWNIDIRNLLFKFKTNPWGCVKDFLGQIEYKSVIEFKILKKIN